MDRFCIQCGRTFAASADEDLCPDCTGTVDGELVSSAPETVIVASVADVPASGVGRSFPTPGSVPEIWSIGDVLLDSYEVGGVLGQGGMARVYRVRHRGWGIDLAVKTPLSHVLAQAGGVESFVDEAGTWVELGLHPNVVACHYVRTLGAIPRVFAELVEGGSLADWIADGRLYEGTSDEVLGRLLDVAIQFAWGLGYAHDQGLVHQDVKPANVLMDVDRDGGMTVKVTDFGLAKSRVVDVEGTSETRVVQGVGGSPAYYSPEQADAVFQATEGYPVNERVWLTRQTDVWSWAVSVLEMFVAERTWRQGNAASSRFDDYVSSGAQVPGVPSMPDGLVGLLGDCFERNPTDRPAGFDDIADRLTAVYFEATDKTYPRPKPRPANLLGASFTNRAISLLEIERPEAAETALLHAQEVDPDLPELVYNKALVDWHAARITDLQAVDRVEACAKGRPGEWRPVQLLAMLHMERRDRVAALQAMEATAPSGTERDQAGRLLSEIGAVSGNWAGQTAQVSEKEEPLSDVIISADGETVVACGSERRAITLDSTGAGSVIQVVNGADASLLRRFVVPYGRLTSVVFAPDEGSFFAASLDSQVVEFPTEAPLRAIWREELPGRSVSGITVSDDGRYLMAVHNKQTYMGAGVVSVWDLRTREVVRELSVKGHTLSGIANSGGMVFSGGSRWTGKGDFLVLVWDLASGNLIHRLGEGMGLNEAAQCMAVIPGTDQLITGHAGGGIYAWDLETGNSIRWVAGTVKAESHHEDAPLEPALNGHTRAVGRVVAHALVPYVVSAGEDDTIRIWDTTTGACLRTLEGHEDGLRGIDLSADATRLVSGSRDGDIRLWNLTEVPAKPRRWAICGISSAREAATTRSRFDDLAAAARRALVHEDWPGAGDLAIRARDLPGMERHRQALALWRDVSLHGRPGVLRSAWTSAELPGHSKPVTSVAIDSGGRLGLSAGADGLIKIWDLQRVELAHVLRGHDGSVAGAALLPDGDRVVSGGQDGSWRLWAVDDPGPGKVLHKGRRTVDVVAATPDGRYLIAGESGAIRSPVVRVYDLERDKSFTLGSHKHMGTITGLAPTPDGRGVLVGEINLTNKPAGVDLHGVLRLFDLDKRECVRVFDAENYPPVAVAMVSDGRRAVTVAWGRSVVVWDVDSHDPVGTIDDVRRGMPDLHDSRGLALRGDGRIALNGGDDGKLRLWDLDRNELIREFEAHPGDVPTCALNADSSVGISGGEDGKVRVWGFDWESRFPDAADFDRAAEPHLEALSTLRARLRGDVRWNEADVDWLHARLGECGYGWIRRGAVRARLLQIGR